MGVRENFNRITALKTLENQGVNYEDKVSKMFGERDENKKQLNPFLKSDGTLVNKHIDYQKVLDSSRVNAKTKELITQATGLTPSHTTPINHTSNPASGGVKINTPTSPGVSAEVPKSVQQNGLVDMAKKYLGTPYVWGGESSAEGGFDCSGFVYNVLKDAGYKVGRTTANGYRGYGQNINRSDMQPGDLLFFGKDGKATHIGIYIGNGQMIHSSGGSKNTKNNPGKGVEIKNIDYRSDFLEARRY